ncbi:MAG TPA: hypothetical protein VLN90_00275 [Thioalkalivibrio sp.]|nr:hypothetical protein [Thioalkalivibrio sp.]
MSTDKDYRPPLADYFDSLESRHGADFNFEKLSDEELTELEHLGRDAVERDPKVSAVEKQNLGMLLKLVNIVRQKRERQ